MSKTVEASRLIDVARRAECSPATVSRVMNGNTLVGDQVRERVLKAATDLGYIPNGSARALRSTRTSLVGVVIPTLDHAIYATMVDAMQTRLAERHVSVIISTSMYDLDAEYEQVRLLVQRGVDSVVLVGAQHLKTTMSLLGKQSIPCVHTYTTGRNDGNRAFGFDNYKSGATAARYLLDLGHRRLAMIAGLTQHNDRATERVQGFRGALAEAGIPAADVTVVESPYSVHPAADAMRELMAMADRPTGVFCGSDIIAAGAVKFCAREGIKVPAEVSVMGFDNLEISELTSPELTTLEVPAREMGRLAADYLTASDAQRQHMQHRELPVRLVVRGSTGQAPASPRSATGTTSMDPRWVGRNGDGS